ncbi:hypothetical protein FACS1894109_21120 [Spirochaetia bacterium]|nr:hypothetical protein FACS1894109_21120 [Spirochaetia bacterium]
MKKTRGIFMIALIGLLCAGSLWAGGRDRGSDGRKSSARTAAAAEAVTINGTLQLVEGRIAVVADGKTYYTSGIQRLIGFIDGLKEGATVRLEGSASAVPLNSNAKFLRITKLTFNGKTYDFPDTAGGFGRW